MGQARSIEVGGCRVMVSGLRGQAKKYGLSILERYEGDRAIRDLKTNNILIWIQMWTGSQYSFHKTEVMWCLSGNEQQHFAQAAGVRWMRIYFYKE